MGFDIKTKSGRELTWHLPAKKPEVNEPVVEFFAAGHELESMDQRFKNLPSAHSWCHWRGDMAQFIYDNLV